MKIVNLFSLLRFFKFSQITDLVWISKPKVGSSKNSIFGSDYNQVTMIDHNEINELRKMTKIDVAKILVNKIINIFDVK